MHVHWAINYEVPNVRLSQEWWVTDARRVSALAAAGDEGHTNLREQRGKIKWQTAEDIEGYSVQVSLKERDRLSLWI